MIYFSPYGYSKNKIAVEFYLPKYATKSDLKTQQVQVHHNLLKKDDLSKLKSEFDELDIDKLAALDPDKLKPVPVDSKKLCDVVDKKVVRKDVNNAKIKDIEDKIPVLLTQLLLLLLMLK